MKTTLLALLLVLTSLELFAQQPPQPQSPAKAASPANRRPPRYGVTNGVPTTPPRYQTANQGSATTPGTTTTAPNPGGVPTGAGNVPGALPQTAAGVPPTPAATTPAPPEEMIAPGTINFEGVDLTEVLDIYAKLVNRTLLRAALPQSQIILKTQTPLTKSEAIEALQAVLALNGVSLVNIGEKFVKVLPSDQAGAAGGELDRSGSTNLPSLGSFLTHVVQLKYVKPSEMAPVITPFAKLKDIIALDGNGILVIRDYAENIKRMLELIEEVDVSVPAEYISEVIPIRYAKVDDIASALNALGGGGSGATVSIGTAPNSGQISGFAPNRSGFGGGMGGMGGMGSMGGAGGMGGGYQGGLGGSSFGGGIGGSSFGGQSRLGGQVTPNGTPSTGTTFQQRLQNIIAATGGSSGGAAGGKQQEIQLFGQTKIIPNESSSSLLIYATRSDMEVIKGIIAKLDVPLPQVLVEAIIMDVTIGNTFNFGISAAQNPVANGQFAGGGGMVNSSSPFIDFIKTVTTNYSSAWNGSNFTQVASGFSTKVSGPSGTNGGFGNALPGGLSYFGNIGPTWDVAVTAAESDSHANIIQRPRIQTSQAKPAQFFVGNTVPYVTGTYNGYSGYGGNSYSQLSVGVELDVTPFINPEGLVVMDIMQEIDDLNGYTAIANVGNVPNTIKRTLNTEIAVRNRDTVMLGGFVKSDKSHSQSGVPFLSDIPILGNLFKQRQDTKDREELVVLMRPTVLNTPQLAAEYTKIEEQRLPGVSEAASQDAAYEKSLINAQRKREEKRSKTNKDYEGFFTPLPVPLTNTPGGPVSALLEDQPDAGSKKSESVSIPQAVHPQANVMNAATPAAPTPGNPAPPQDAAALQQQAAAALAQKMAEINSGKAPPTPSPAPTPNPAPNPQK